VIFIYFFIAIFKHNFRLLPLTIQLAQFIQEQDMIFPCCLIPNVLTMKKMDYFCCFQTNCNYPESHFGAFLRIRFHHD
jgi:hypothetical protein